MRLRDRYQNARRLLARVTDVRGQVVEHPLPALGIAFAFGLYAGLRSRVSEHAPGDSALHHKLTDAVVAAIGSVLVTLARDAVVHSARLWIEREDELRVH